MNCKYRHFAIGLLVALFCTCACAQEAAVEFKLDLPADYRATSADYLTDASKVLGGGLGFPAPDSRDLSGKTLKERNGVYPIHITSSHLTKHYEGEPLLKDDLILAVNGTPLGEDAITQFRSAAENAQTPAHQLMPPLQVTRWRKGTIETVSLKLKDYSLPIPDLTKGEKPNKTLDWALGPIGVNGWGHSEGPGRGASKHAWQFLVTLVHEGGPAVGKLELWDVILGASGTSKPEPFTYDARKALAAAIDEAEKEENKGKLNLLVWRSKTPRTREEVLGRDKNTKDKRQKKDKPLTKSVIPEGAVQVITIDLPVLGTYSETTPFNCPKTERIIDNAVEYVKKNKERMLEYISQDQGGTYECRWNSYITALGLLATGREDVMPMVKELAHKTILKPGEKLSVETHVPMESWRWSYRTLFMCEYYLRTKDKAVLPTIEEFATKIAMGQSGAGTWGHTFAARENTGYLHGHLGGYGAINQVGLTLMAVLPLARKCGINNKEIREAIKRGDDFFGYFIGKGSIPYGDHGPGPWYDDNGKSGSASIFFDLMGNRKGTRFFSEMILASSPGGRENGHTGHFWGHLWGGMGAARAGDKGLQVYTKEMNYLFTLSRQYDGHFVFQWNVGELQHAIGTPKLSGKPTTIRPATGAMLMQLCVPRRTLYITGKETPRETHLTQERIDRLLQTGRLNYTLASGATLTTPEILELLKDPLPPTRSLAVRILRHKKIDCVKTLIAMLDSKDPYARYGAAEALGEVGSASKEAGDKLIAMMQTDKDTLFRIYAIGVLSTSKAGLSDDAKRAAIPILLRMATERPEDDPRRVLQAAVSKALFNIRGARGPIGLMPFYEKKDGKGAPIAESDRQLLVSAVKDILTNQNGAAREHVAGYAFNILTEQECAQLWRDIYLSIRYIAPSGIMFAPRARTYGLDLMAKRHIKEGIFLGAWYVRWQKNHGADRRIPQALEALKRYGRHAASQTAYLEEHAKYWEQRRGQKAAERIRDFIKQIGDSTEVPDLVSIERFLKQGDVPPRDGR